MANSTYLAATNATVTLDRFYYSAGVDRLLVGRLTLPVPGEPNTL